MPPNPVPRVLAVLPAVIPSTLITVVKPFLALHRAGRVRARVVLEREVRAEDVSASDVVALCRNVEPGPAIDRLCEEAGVPYVYDLDDNFFVIPLTLEQGRYHRAPERIAQLERYLAGAAVVRVYSETLERRVRTYTDRVVRATASVDLRLVEPGRAARQETGRTRVVYSTSRIEDELSAAFLPDLEALVERRQGVELWFMGSRPRHFRHPRA
ncbi:MAG TPA: hypothetical protein VFV66_06505, partial [Nonomuraea sp.]|nr:hypothetical protein [Nonomuraea sp.]